MMDDTIAEVNEINHLVGRLYRIHGPIRVVYHNKTYNLASICPRRARMLADNKTEQRQNTNYTRF